MEIKLVTEDQSPKDVLNELISKPGLSDQEKIRIFNILRDGDPNELDNQLCSSALELIREDLSSNVYNQLVQKFSIEDLNQESNVPHTVPQGAVIDQEQNTGPELEAAQQPIINSDPNPEPPAEQQLKSSRLKPITVKNALFSIGTGALGGIAINGLIVEGLSRSMIAAPIAEQASKLSFIQTIDGPGALIIGAVLSVGMNLFLRRNKSQ